MQADAHGCAEAPNWNFNVSHEGAFVVLAAEPRLLCGVDVAAPSQLRRRGAPQPAAELLELLSAQFSPSERDAVLGAGSEEARADTLRALWSLKEAYVKARGDGLGFDLSRATFGWAPAAAADPAADPPAEAILMVDGVPQSAAWRFTMQKLGGRAADGCHWVSVALGPPSAAVDAQGSFRATFRCPAAELSAVEAGDAPPFSLLTVRLLFSRGQSSVGPPLRRAHVAGSSYSQVFDLIPDEARPAYLAAGGEPFF